MLPYVAGVFLVPLCSRLESS